MHTVEDTLEPACMSVSCHFWGVFSLSIEPLIFFANMLSILLFTSMCKCVNSPPSLSRILLVTLSSFVRMHEMAVTVLQTVSRYEEYILQRINHLGLLYDFNTLDMLH